MQAHAASRAIVPESALPFGGAVLPSAPEYAAPAWWPDEGEPYLLRALSNAALILRSVSRLVFSPVLSSCNAERWVFGTGF